MNRRQNQIDHYFRVKIEGASPMGLIYILYDGAIKDMNEALKELNGRNRNKYSTALIHAQDCIRELRNALSFEKGAQHEIAASLYRLYTYCINQLIEANLNRKDPSEHLEMVLKIMIGLKSSWQEGEKKLKLENGGQIRRDVSFSA